MEENGLFLMCGFSEQENEIVLLYLVYREHVMRLLWLVNVITIGLAQIAAFRLQKVNTRHGLLFHIFRTSPNCSHCWCFSRRRSSSCLHCHWSYRIWDSQQKKTSKACSPRLLKVHVLSRFNLHYRFINCFQLLVFLFLQRSKWNMTSLNLMYSG